MERFSISHGKLILIKLSLAQLFPSLANSNPNSRFPPAPCMLKSQQGTRRSTPVWLFNCGDKHDSRLVFGIWLVEDTSQPEWERRGSVSHWLLAKTTLILKKASVKSSQCSGGHLIYVFSQPTLSYIFNKPASLCPAARDFLPNNSLFNMNLGACRNGGKLPNWRMPACMLDFTLHLT